MDTHDMAGQHRNQTTTDAESLTSRLRVRECLKSTQGIAMGYRFRATGRFAFASGPIKQGVGVELTTADAPASCVVAGTSKVVVWRELSHVSLVDRGYQSRAPLVSEW
jgi:hypothetical protein